MEILKKKLIISFSGGETSGYMLKYCLDNYSNEYEILVIYANTGKEDEKTLKFIEQCSKEFEIKIHWVESIIKTKKGWGVDFKLVDFKTASRNGEPFEEMLSYLGLPCSHAPFCSVQLKKLPINAFIKSINWEKCFIAIGIRADEIDRISVNHKKQRIIYPLVENNIKRKDINEFWEKQKFKLELKQPLGNCDVCWKKSDRKLLEIAYKYPEKFGWWIEMESKYQGIRIDGKTSFYRGGRNAEYFIKLSETIGAQLDLFKFDDTPNGCSESCEPF